MCAFLGSIGEVGQVAVVDLYWGVACKSKELYIIPVGQRVYGFRLEHELWIVQFFYVSFIKSGIIELMLVLYKDLNILLMQAFTTIIIPHRFLTR